MTDKPESSLHRITEIAEEAAERPVHKTLMMIGIDAGNPLKAQKDFAVMREVGELVSSDEFRKDIEHTRKWRNAMEALQSKGRMTAAGMIVAGLLAALWMGLNDMLDKH